MKQGADASAVKQEPDASAVKQEPDASAVKQEPDSSAVKQEPGEPGELADAVSGLVKAIKGSEIPTGPESQFRGSMPWCTQSVLAPTRRKVLTHGVW